MDDRAERLTTERAEQSAEMGGMRGASCGVKSREMRWGREGVRELIIYQGHFRKCKHPTVIKTKRQQRVLIYGPQRSINYARFGLAFCLSPKRNFFQEVAFWAQPNAFFCPLFYLCAFWASKSPNKRTLTLSLTIICSLHFSQLLYYFNFYLILIVV